MVLESRRNPGSERRRIVFYGRVQGVGFRATARDTAGTHPVSGWVRNEPDGTVLMEVQGTRAAIDAYLTDLRRQLDRLITRESTLTMPPSPEESGFEIRR